MGIEWKCTCKDCGQEFFYSDTKYQTHLARGESRPERCDECRRKHKREIDSIGQAFYKVKPLRPILNAKELTSDLGRFYRADRPHVREETTPKPLDPNKYGVKDDRIIEFFHFFKHDPKLQVVVVEGPTGSGKSTYFPFRLLDMPTRCLNEQGIECDRYWTVPIETDQDLELAQKEVENTQLFKGLYRHYWIKPNDPRAVEHRIEDIDPKMFWRYGQIVVTQPRIQATRRIPDHIARDMVGCRLGAGHDVGYKHRNAFNVDSYSKLAFVTDGTLINYIDQGKLDGINTIMIDEAHERGLNIDLIIGMLTQLLPSYPRLKLIIASATISSEQFINHFNKYLPKHYDSKGNLLPNCRIIKFEGKSFKVSPHFQSSAEELDNYYRSPLKTSAGNQDSWEGLYRNPQKAYEPVAEKAVKVLNEMYNADSGGYIEVEEKDENGNNIKIDITERQGDILCFLQTTATIDKCCDEIRKRAGESPNLSELIKSKKLCVLPLYSGLDQAEQDKALAVRPQSHNLLGDKILECLQEMARGVKPQGDVIAILNNAGQIHNLCSDLTQRISNDTISVDNTKDPNVIPNPLKAFNEKKKIVFIPWFTEETAKQLFEPSDDRCKFHLIPSSPDVIRVVISTKRRSSELIKDEFKYIIELPLEERHVVVSTNVAETSLTIEGILHVVDAGLILQDFWDTETQTKSFRPVLQSRAGCKQRWGRAGRLQAGDAWLLYTRAQFGNEQEEEEKNPSPKRCFDFYTKPQIKRISLEQALLQAKKSGIENLNPDSFPWLDPPNQLELNRAERVLREEGAVDDVGDLTERGVEYGKMQMDVKAASALVAADHFSCAYEAAVVISFANIWAKNTNGVKNVCLDKSKIVDVTDYEINRRQSTIIANCQDDIELALKLTACWEEVTKAGRLLVQLFLKVNELVKDDEFESFREVLVKYVRDIKEQSKDSRFSTIIDICKGLTPKTKKPIFRKFKDYLYVYAQFILYEDLIFIIANNQFFNEIWNKVIESISEFKISDYNEVKEELKSPLSVIDIEKKAEVYSDWNQCDQKIQDKYWSILKKSLDKFPLALATAWANSNYLDAKFFIDAATERRNLLESLEAHKKGVEERDIDLSRIDRIRLLFTLAYSSNIYKQDDFGRYESIDLTNNSLLEIQFNNNSVCAFNKPKIFACLNRNAGNCFEGRYQILYASFIIRIPESWNELINREKILLCEYSPVQLLQIVSRFCKTNNDSKQQITCELMFSQNSIWRVRLNNITSNGDWSVTIIEPCSHSQSFELKKESSGVKGDIFLYASRTGQRGEEFLGETDREIGKNSGFDADAPEWGITAEEYEELYSAEEDFKDEEVSTKNKDSNLSDDDWLDDDNSKAFANTKKSVDNSIANSWSWKTCDGLLKTGDKNLEIGQILKAEVCSYNKTGSILFTYPIINEQFDKFNKCIGNNHKTLWCKKHAMTALRVENLPSSGESVLIARHNKSGCEVVFSACDLAFHNCPVVPRLVFDNLPEDKQFEAKIVYIDPDSHRLRMTTHHVFEEVLDEEKISWEELVENKLKVDELQDVGDEQFVLIDCLNGLLSKGFVAAVQLQKGRKTEYFDKSNDVFVQICGLNHKGVEWPRDIVKPNFNPKNSFRYNENNVNINRVKLFRRPQWDEFMNWYSECVNNTYNDQISIFQQTLYKLYEQTRQLFAVDGLSIKRYDNLVGTDISGSIRVHDKGVALSVKKDDYEFRVWLAKDDYSWWDDESIDSLHEGDILTVRITEVDWAKFQLIGSRKALFPNPYLDYQVGQVVDCVSKGITERGLRVSIDRLNGFIYERDLAWLPDEGDIREEGRCFNAKITGIDEVKRRIQLERCSIVFKRLFDKCGYVEVKSSKYYTPNISHKNDAHILLGKIAEEIEEESEDNLGGFIINISEGIKGFLPRVECPKNANFYIGQELRLVLLPPKDQRIGVSVKRTQCVQYFSLRDVSPGAIIGKDGINLKNIKGDCTDSKIHVSLENGYIISSVVNSFNDIKRKFKELVTNCGGTLYWESSDPKRKGPCRLTDIFKPNSNSYVSQQKSPFLINLPSVDKDFPDFHPKTFTSNVVDNSSTTRKSNEVGVPINRVKKEDSLNIVSKNAINVTEDRNEQPLSNASTSKQLNPVPSISQNPQPEQEPKEEPTPESEQEPKKDEFLKEECPELAASSVVYEHPFKDCLLTPFFSVGTLLRLGLLSLVTFLCMFVLINFFLFATQRLLQDDQIMSTFDFMNTMWKLKVVPLIFSFITGIFSASFMIKIFEDSANGSNEFNWEDDLYEGNWYDKSWCNWLEWDWRLSDGYSLPEKAGELIFHGFLWSLLISLQIMIGGILGAFLFSTIHISSSVGFVLSSTLLTPIFFISCFQVKNPFKILSKNIIISLINFRKLWLLFFILKFTIILLTIGVVFIDVNLITHAYVKSIHSFWNIAGWSLILAFELTIISALYMRVLGRFAWIIKGDSTLLEHNNSLENPRNGQKIFISLIQVTATVILAVCVLMTLWAAISNGCHYQKSVKSPKLLQEQTSSEAKPKNSNLLHQDDKKKTPMPKSTYGRASFSPPLERWKKTQNMKAGTRYKLLIDGIECGFRWIPPGEFSMGSPKSESNRDGDEILHKVQITKGFWIMETPVVQKFYQRVMTTNPSRFKGDDLPVEKVSYYDAVEFCQSLKNLLPKSFEVSLPTEAEWEYVCRAGTTTAYSWGEVWEKNKGNDWEGGIRKTTPVKKYPPNAWGVYDMHGNVWEWCNDGFGAYDLDNSIDPQGASDEENRVIRGGGWVSVAEDCRSANRHRRGLGDQLNYLGFRIVLRYN